MGPVLVTGANGFIGGHLVKALVARQRCVHGLVRCRERSRRVAELGAELCVGDVGDVSSLRRATVGKSVVFHLAGVTKARNREKHFEVNAVGTRNLLTACAAQEQPPLVVLVSSLAAAGPSRTGTPRQESEQPTPVSHYGCSKLAGERSAHEMAGRVPCTIVRPGIVIGEGDKATLSMFRSVYWLRLHVLPGLVAQRFSVLHASDLVELLLRIAVRGERLPAEGSGATEAAPVGTGIYFAESGQRPTYREIGRLIGRSMGHSTTIMLPLPRPIVWGVAGATQLGGRLVGKAVFLSLDKAREATTGEWICNGQKASHQLGFQVHTDLAARFRQTADWYRREGWL